MSNRAIIGEAKAGFLCLGTRAAARRPGRVGRSRAGGKAVYLWIRGYARPREQLRGARAIIGRRRSLV